jgi:transcriptional regulator with XRE-family HTH domain
MKDKHLKDGERQLRLVAEAVRTRRKEMGLSQERLAEGLEISTETIKRIEQREGWISLKMLHYVCREMQIKITIG